MLNLDPRSRFAEQPPGHGHWDLVIIDECISRQTQDGSPLPFALSPTPFHRFAFKGWGEGWGEGCMLTSALMNKT